MKLAWDEKDIIRIIGLIKDEQDKRRRKKDKRGSGKQLVPIEPSTSTITAAEFNALRFSAIWKRAKDENDLDLANLCLKEHDIFWTEEGAQKLKALAASLLALAADVGVREGFSERTMRNFEYIPIQ